MSLQNRCRKIVEALADDPSSHGYLSPDLTILVLSNLLKQNKVSRFKLSHIRCLSNEYRKYALLIASDEELLKVIDEDKHRCDFFDRLVKDMSEEIYASGDGRERFPGLKYVMGPWKQGNPVFKYIANNDNQHCHKYGYKVHLQKEVDETRENIERGHTIHRLIKYCLTKVRHDYVEEYVILMLNRYLECGETQMDTAMANVLVKCLNDPLSTHEYGYVLMLAPLMKWLITYADEDELTKFIKTQETSPTSKEIEVMLLKAVDEYKTELSCVTDSQITEEKLSRFGHLLASATRPCQQEPESLFISNSQITLSRFDDLLAPVIRPCQQKPVDMESVKDIAEELRDAKIVSDDDESDWAMVDA